MTWRRNYARLTSGWRILTRGWWTPPTTLRELRERWETWRAKGMTQVAKDAGMGRESLYKALGGEGNQRFDTVLRVARALGVKFHATAA